MKILKYPEQEYRTISIPSYSFVGELLDTICSIPILFPFWLCKNNDEPRHLFGYKEEKISIPVNHSEIIIDFEDDAVKLGCKITELKDENMIFQGVIPLCRIKDNVFKCCCDYCENNEDKLSTL